jgi:sugar O-acyltransferase (sialic acid O-acetyltransferase NeuD family)
MKPVVIYGAGESAEVAHYYFIKYSDLRITGFVVDDQYLDVDTLFDLPIIPFSRIGTEFPKEDFDVFVAIGYSGMNQNRADAFTRIKGMGYDCPSFISPDCNCYTENIGENCFILEDNTIQPFVSIGDNCVIWSGNHIGHHSVIEAHCYLTSHVVISGGCTIGSKSFLGVNATFRDHVTIGASCMVGMAASVEKNLPDQSVVRAPRSKLMEIKSTELKGF